MIDWLNTLLAAVGLFTAIVAILQTRRANKAAAEANEISRGANHLSGQANQYAEKALRLQEDDGKVKLVVEPRIFCIVGKGEDLRPRPVVKVVNLSTFHVMIEAIGWKTNREDIPHYYWHNPEISGSFGRLPVRLPPRESMVALGIPPDSEALKLLDSIVSAVVYTACGEKFEGMTEDWRIEVARMVSEAASREGQR